MILLAPFRWFFGGLVRSRAMFGTAIRGVVNRPLRMFLSTLGIFIGVTTLIGVVSVVKGAQKAFTEQLASLGANTIYVTQMPWMHAGPDWWKFRNRPPVTTRDVDALRRNAVIIDAV